MSRRCFIKIDPRLDEDEKTLQLADDLGLDIDVVTGKLIRLWSWAFGHAEDGDLSSLTPRQFALVMRLPGSTGEQLVKSLRECGFMDEWQLHSWDNWGGTLAAQRREEAARQAALRAKSHGCHSDITQESSRAKRESEKEKEKEKEQRTPPMVPPTDDLVRQAQQLEGWKPRPDDERTFSEWRMVYSDRQLGELLRKLQTYQVGKPPSQKYKDLRMAFANWLKREEPEPPGVDENGNAPPPEGMRWQGSLDIVKNRTVYRLVPND